MNVLQGLRSTSLVQPPSTNYQTRQQDVQRYVQLLISNLSANFDSEVEQLLQHHYPSPNKTLLDEVLVSFVVRCPEHACTVILPLARLVSEAKVVYNRHQPPFHAFGSLFQITREEHPETLSVPDSSLLTCFAALRAVTLGYARALQMCAPGAAQVASWLLESLKRGCTHSLDASCKLYMDWLVSAAVGHTPREHHAASASQPPPLVETLRGLPPSLTWPREVSTDLASRIVQEVCREEASKLEAARAAGGGPLLAVEAARVLLLSLPSSPGTAPASGAIDADVAVHPLLGALQAFLVPLAAPAAPPEGGGEGGRGRGRAPPHADEASQPLGGLFEALVSSRSRAAEGPGEDAAEAAGPSPDAGIQLLRVLLASGPPPPGQLELERDPNEVVAMAWVVDEVLPAVSGALGALGWGGAGPGAVPCPREAPHPPALRVLAWLFANLHTWFLVPADGEGAPASRALQTMMASRIAEWMSGHGEACELVVCRALRASWALRDGPLHAPGARVDVALECGAIRALMAVTEHLPGGSLAQGVLCDRMDVLAGGIARRAAQGAGRGEEELEGLRGLVALLLGPHAGATRAAPRLLSRVIAMLLDPSAHAPDHRTAHQEVGGPRGAKRSRPDDDDDESSPAKALRRADGSRQAAGTAGPACMDVPAAEASGPVPAGAALSALDACVTSHVCSLAGALHCHESGVGARPPRPPPPPAQCLHTLAAVLRVDRRGDPPPGPAPSLAPLAPVPAHIAACLSSSPPAMHALVSLLSLPSLAMCAPAASTAPQAPPLAATAEILTALAHAETPARIPVPVAVYLVLRTIQCIDWCEPPGSSPGLSGDEWMRVVWQLGWSRLVSSSGCAAEALPLLLQGLGGAAAGQGGVRAWRAGADGGREQGALLAAVCMLAAAFPEAVVPRLLSLLRCTPARPAAFPTRPLPCGAPMLVGALVRRLLTQMLHSRCAGVVSAIAAEGFVLKQALAEAGQGSGGGEAGAGTNAGQELGMGCHVEGWVELLDAATAAATAHPSSALHLLPLVQDHLQELTGCAGSEVSHIRRRALCVLLRLVEQPASPSTPVSGPASNGTAHDVSSTAQRPLRQLVQQHIERELNYRKARHLNTALLAEVARELGV